MLRLIVFSDDWGRHPSSCQHLASKLLATQAIQAIWVNTIGTRTPKLSFEDLGKAAVKITQWLRPPRKTTTSPDNSSPAQPKNLTIVTPKMLPTFRSKIARRINAHLIARAVNRALPPRQPAEKRVVITTLPITADLVDRIDADRWLYYCVDDFAVWPGLDGNTMRDMERQLVPNVDALIAVSDTLQKHLSDLSGPTQPKPTLLTHGIDLWHWSPAQSGRFAGPDPNLHGYNRTPLPDWWPKLSRPIVLFWGLIDKRLDTELCKQLSAWTIKHNAGSIVLVGPAQSPDPTIQALPGFVMPGPVQYQRLPALAAEADVLIMPYADLPVTRAMQPLKFKEYLATGKPVVARDLPATREWVNCADIVAAKESFIERVDLRAKQGITQEQTRAREQRLPDQTWHYKAEQFEQAIQNLFNPEPKESTNNHPAKAY